jgi:hypothetical protein
LVGLEAVCGRRIRLLLVVVVIGVKLAIPVMVFLKGQSIQVMVYRLVVGQFLHRRFTFRQKARNRHLGFGEVRTIRLIRPNRVATESTSGYSSDGRATRT